MFKRFREFFSRSEQQRENEEAAYEAWYEEKTRRMEGWLGVEHDMVMHALIPYAVGGGLDLYYFPNGIEGTAIATKELCEAPGEGPSNQHDKTYELVMFTRGRLDLDQAKAADTEFGAAHANLNLLLNHIARYSEMATLNPRETCEFPSEMEDVGGKCLIFDAYPPGGQARDFGLLAVIEVFRSEMEFAQARGGQLLLDRLKAADHYPYSDLGRDPVA